MSSFYDELTHEEKILVNAELQNSGKSTLVAYVLWFFLGYLGAHRFYLGKPGSALVQATTTVFGYLTLVFLIGFGLLFIVGVWMLLDLVFIQKIIEEDKMTLRQAKAKKLLDERHAKESATL